MDIASVQGSNVLGQIAQARGGTGPLGEQPGEVGQALSAPPQGEGPQNAGGVAAPAQNDSSGGNANTRDGSDEEALTYTAAGALGGADEEGGASGGTINVTA